MNSEDRMMTHSHLPTLSEVLAPLYRYRWAALLAFSVVLGGTVIGVMLIQPSYESTMKVLVKRERMDPVMSPSPNASAQDRVEVTEDELNSEVEILKSRDLL